jgi:hypothetical protein
MSKRTKRSHEVSATTRPNSATTIPGQETIALRAYRLWLDRGCPFGSEQEDWFRAEGELRSEADKAA